MSRAPVHEPAAQSQADRGVLPPEIQEALAALSEVEARYESELEGLKGWSGPNAIRVRFIEHLDARHADAREPLVQLLADLHQQITTAAMLQSLRSSQHKGAEVSNGSGRVRPSRGYRLRGESQWGA
jgi:putative heme iron utilization protein